MSDGPAWAVGRSGLLPEARQARRPPAVAVALAAATGLSATLVHAFLWQRQADPLSAAALTSGATYAAALLGILLVHEAGHQWAARHHGVPVSAPLLLPFPLLFGTFGAVIHLRGRPRDRHALLVLGLAGPLAGGLAILAVLVIRGVLGAPDLPGTPSVALAAPLGWRVLGGSPTVDPADPLAFAAWTGAFVTWTNLLPFGQLDGGHAAAALAPRWHRALGWGVTGGLLVGALWWPAWALWAIGLQLLGSRSALAIGSASAPPGRTGWALAAVAGVLALACAVPVPF